MRFMRHVSARFVASLAAVILLALFVVNGVALTSIQASRGWMVRTRRAQALVSAIRGALVDAETGQRGFLLTGRVDHLQPFEAATTSLTATVDELQRLTGDDPEQQRNVIEVRSLAAKKIDELRRTIDLHRAGDIKAALAVVRSDDGKQLMDRIRQLIATMREHEDARLEGRAVRARRNLDIAVWVDGAAVVGLLALGFALFMINRDIARREQLEKALRDAASFQEQFVAIVSHDLRNPLGAITLAAQRLQQAGLPDTVLRPVTILQNAAGRMSRLIDQLFDLARARHAGGIPIQPTPDTDLAQIVRDTVEELCSANPGAEVRVEDVPSVCGAWDSDRLTQVVSNLIGNAIAHGVGPVRVRVHRASELAVLEVRNGGAPIPPEMMPRLFEAFRGSSRPALTPKKGLGLGLYIAERIVTAHGGKITAQSSERDGTTFTIRLPMGAASPSSEPIPRMVTAEATAPEVAEALVVTQL